VTLSVTARSTRLFGCLVAPRRDPAPQGVPTPCRWAIYYTERAARAQTRGNASSRPSWQPWARSG